MKMSTSQKREVLNINNSLVNEKTVLANNVLTKLNSYKETYLQEIKEDATIEEVIQTIHSFNGNKLLSIKHSKNMAKLKTTFPELNDAEVLALLDSKSQLVVDQLVQQSNEINAALKNSGLTIENFVLNGEFIMNSKVEGRIKNMATTLCTNENQKELRNLAIKLSDIVKKALRTGLVSTNRLQTNVDNIIDINTGEIQHTYIRRR